MSSAARSRGVSLIEALVALAVMAFGLLGVVGMQATLRFNADVSRQRAEAVRMAQEKMEALRAFGVLGSVASAGEHGYADIISATDTPPPPASAAAASAVNATFTRVTTVVNPTTDEPRMKQVQVAVSWLDRRTAAGGASEVVRLTSNIAEVAPEVMASLGLPGDRSGVQRPLGRHRSIPQGAGTGPIPDTSSFSPPGAATGLSWIFANATGKITSVCSAPGVCIAVSGWLASGYVQFIDPTTAPTPGLAENPNGNAASFSGIGVQVVLTVPSAPTVPPACYSAAVSQGLAYYCFVPTDTVTTVWSGTTLLTPLAQFAPAPTATASNPALWKSCRYTPQPSHTPSGGNEAHPLTYSSVASSLTNQNFLVFRAGDSTGTNANLCPGAGSNPLINSTTFAHQPSA